MAGQKRAAADSGVSTRASKAAKTGDATSPKAAAKKGAKRGPKTSITATAFKSKATPLHINITHTAPPEATEGETKDEKETSDPGHVASATLLPSVFSTGSYGWKGSKRVSIEVEKENGEKETVQVMISINATVIGSKQADGEGAENGEEKKDEDEGAVAEEKATSDAEKNE